MAAAGRRPSSTPAGCGWTTPGPRSSAPGSIWPNGSAAAPGTGAGCWTTSGTIAVGRYIPLRDPDGHVPFPLERTDRRLTGADFDTWQWGVKGELAAGDALFTVAWNGTGDGADLPPPPPASGLDDPQRGAGVETVPRTRWLRLPLAEHGQQPLNGFDRKLRIGDRLLSVCRIDVQIARDSAGTEG